MHLSILMSHRMLIYPLDIFMCRWVFSVIDQLPTYMQHCYKALFDLYVEIEEELGKIEKSYLVHYVIEEVINLLLAKLIIFAYIRSM